MQKKAIHQRAKATGITVTDCLTTCAMGKEIVRVGSLDEVLSEPNAQGRNLNRLTTQANMGRITVLHGNDLVQECTRLCDTLGALIREVRWWQPSPRSNAKSNPPVPCAA